MPDAFFVRGLHVRRWKGKEEETAPFDGLAEAGRFESIPSFYAHNP